MAKKNTSWGGRFKKHTAKKAQEFSSSIDIDNKLYKEDILGSIAYAEALQNAGVLNKSELSKIKSCLLYTSPSPRDTIRSRMPSSA